MQMKMVNAVSARFTGTNGDVSEEWYQIEDGKTCNVVLRIKQEELQHQTQINIFIIKK
jgi:uncharacterized membrane protein